MKFAFTAISLPFLIATSVSAQPAQLKYNFQPGQSVAYNVTVTVNTPSAKETMSGVIRYTGKPNANDTTTVSFFGGLKKSTRSKSRNTPFRGGFGRPGGGPPRPRLPFEEPDFRGLVTSNKTSLVIESTGNVKSRTQDSQLPYVLGNLDLLVFQPLPKTQRQSWNVSTGVSITSEDKPAFGPRFGPFAQSSTETNEGGSERYDYQITGTKGDLVTISKQYALKSPPPTRNKTGYEMTGNGTWIFNQKDGLSQSMKEELKLKIVGGNVDVTYPITINWQRMSDKELADHEAAVAKRQEELKQRMAKQQAARKAAGPKPINSHRKSFVMKQLKSNPIAIWGQLQGLKRIGPTPAVKEDMDLMTRVGVLRSHKDGKVNTAANELWLKWKDRFEELASDEQKAEVAAANGESVEAMNSDENPFEVVPEDDGTGERTWQDSTGKFKIVGTFEKVQGSMVLLKNPQGKTVRIPKARLSKDDQAIVEKLTK